jgi:hypothetical protein
MRPWLARVLAVVLTVLPWASALAQPRPTKADTTLSGPQTPQPVLQQLHASSGTPPSPGLWQPWTLEAHEHVRLDAVLIQSDAVRMPSRPRYLECLKLQLDGG